MDVQKTKTLENEDRRPDVENGDLENQDPLKITWKRLETANNYFQTLHECKKQHVFQLSKILTRCSFSRRRKRRHPSKSLGNVSLCSSCFRFLLANRELRARFSLLPPSLKIFAPLRRRLLTSLTSSWLKGNGKIVMFLTLLLCLEVEVGFLRFPGLENEDPVQNFG